MRAATSETAFDTSTEQAAAKQQVSPPIGASDVEGYEVSTFGANLCMVNTT
jgi:hypothetical protein